MSLQRGAGRIVQVAGTATTPVTVPAPMVKQHALVHGARVAGKVRRGQQGPELASVEQVCGLDPQAYRTRKPFEQLVPISPSDRLRLADSGEMSMRLVDLIAPVGKGTRGLIVAPPKAGKTTLLEHLGHAVRLASPETRMVVLLIDERPEEVTYFRRTLDAEVFASSSDQPVREHVELSELMLAHIRTELECGHDVIVLLDSLTRLVRALDRQGVGRSRTLSGGLDAGSLEPARRFFGLARNIEGGGSVTLLATVLVDTGSRQDQLIYEEFKATGNSEIVLDRALAEAGVFPAVDLLASSTRRDDLLYAPDDLQRLARLRRVIAGRRPKDALVWLLGLLREYPTNQALLERIPLA
jgi:transcription termination factor Rho